MILVRPSHEIQKDINSDDILGQIERAGRTCYKTEEKITDNSARQFVKMIIDRGHESVIEHENLTVKFICDRGVTHELVRHRIAAFSQESTRYCNYKDRVTFIIPPWFDGEEGVYKKYDAFKFHNGNEDAAIWFSHMVKCEEAYQRLIKIGQHPQQARSVLPNSLKTEITMTANLREWRHVFTLRTSSAAHPQMRELMIPLLRELKRKIPVVFDDIRYH